MAMKVIDSEVIPGNTLRVGEVGQGREGDQPKAQCQVPWWELWLDLSGSSGDNVITSQSCPHQGEGTGIFISPMLPITGQGLLWEGLSGLPCRQSSSQTKRQRLLTVESRSV